MPNLGSTLVTDDVHIVVFKNTTSIARNLLATSDKIMIEPRTRHTHRDSTPPVEIEILAPPGLFKGSFTESSTTLQILVDGSVVNILYPVALLNAKYRSTLGRASTEKKEADFEDIEFLLDYLARNGMYPASGDVPSAGNDVVMFLVKAYKKEDIWKRAGYDSNTGKMIQAHESTKRLPMRDRHVHQAATIVML